MFELITDYNELEDGLFNELSYDDYLIFGYGSYRNNQDRKPECAEARFGHSLAAITHLAKELKIPRKKLAYFIKDEVSGGVRSPNGYGHQHHLISSYKLEDVDKVRCAEIMTSYWQDRIGICDFQPFDITRKAKGIRYIAKVRQNKQVVMSGFRMSKAMNRRLSYLKKQPFTADYTGD